MSLVNRVTINPPKPAPLKFCDIGVGQLFRAINHQRADNVYMKTFRTGENAAIALWSGDLCCPNSHMEIELISSVTVVSV